MRTINEIIVHCAATRPGWWENENVHDKRDEIRRWHVEDRGWRDIGYHFIVDRDGSVAKGRPTRQAGAHVKGRNRNSVGICLIGGHGSSASDDFSDNFTRIQMNALLNIIADLKKIHPGIVKISGHNEYSNKACPGFHVSEALEKYHGPKEASASPEAIPQRKKIQSRTLQGATTAAVGGIGGIVAAISQLDGNVQLALIGAAALCAVGVIVVFRERLLKWSDGER